MLRLLITALKRTIPLGRMVVRRGTVLAAHMFIRESDVVESYVLIDAPPPDLASSPGGMVGLTSERNCWVRCRNGGMNTALKMGSLMIIILVLPRKMMKEGVIFLC